MNAGFSNLDTLKHQLLGGQLKSETQFDVLLKGIGLGMARMIESACNRRFQRTVGQVDILRADQVHFLLSRYPVESVASIDTKVTEADGWTAQTVNEFVQTIDLAAGIIYLPEGADVGLYHGQVRITYTGGYWWQTLEPKEAGYVQDEATGAPAGAALIPDDLRAAWLLQCQEVWNKRDKLGLGIADKPDEQGKLSELRLVPLVKEMLKEYIRFQMV
jgi:hypothetical protein